MIYTLKSIKTFFVSFFQNFKLFIVFSQLLFEGRNNFLASLAVFAHIVQLAVLALKLQLQLIYLILQFL